MATGFKVCVHRNGENLHLKLKGNFDGTSAHELLTVMNLLQVNKRLHLLGWDSVELDYHTLQLAIACFEAEGLKGLENRDRGRPRDLRPPTPPCIRVRTRRFI